MDVFVDHDTYLDMLHHDKVNELLPVIIVISLLMAVGFVGNISALLFYWRRARRSSTTIFIIALTVTDILVCCVMVLEIIDLANTYVFENEIACKLYLYANHTTFIASGLILVIIAIDRYRKLCQPLKKQLTSKHAKLVVGIHLSLAMFMALPVFFLYGTVEIQIQNDHNITFPVNGSDCAARHENEVFQIAIHIVYLCVFTICTLILIVLYSLIGRVIYRYHKTHKNFKNDLNQVNAQDHCSTSSVGKTSEGVVANIQEQTSSSNMNKCNGCITAHTEIHIALSADSNTADNAVASSTSRLDTGTTGHAQVRSSSSSVSDSGTFINDSQNSSTVPKPSKGKANKKYRKTVAAMKMTIMLFIIAIIFIASFVPYHIVTILRHQRKDEWETVCMQLALRSYLLNSVVNPFVYGLFNAEFRRFFTSAASLACRKCHAYYKCRTETEISESRC